MISKNLKSILVFFIFVLCALSFIFLNSTNNHKLVKLKRRSVETKELGESINRNQKLASVQELKSEIKNLENYLPKNYASVRNLIHKEVKRILVTGGAGFVGSHLVDYLMMQGNEVTCIDNFFTGHRRNIQQWLGHKNFKFIHHDVTDPIFLEVDEIYHLASPASPPHYMKNPIKTIKTNTIGTINLLDLAKRLNAKILIASSSEVYGDPLQHPQKETYFGNVNTMGPRSCYDEGKRVAESLAYAYSEQENVKISVARIFNTYGPRMNILDGRVVSNFITQALKNESITVYGNGKQTRSFQYVTDLVNGLVLLMNSNLTTPVNLGNPDEYQIIDFAKKIKRNLNSESKIVFLQELIDDPKKRRPDIEKAIINLNWKPIVSLEKGLSLTVDYFSAALKTPD